VHVQKVQIWYYKPSKIYISRSTIPLIKIISPLSVTQEHLARPVYSYSTYKTTDSIAYIVAFTAHADFFYAVITVNTKSAAADKSTKERKSKFRVCFPFSFSADASQSGRRGDLLYLYIDIPPIHMKNSKQNGKQRLSLKIWLVCLQFIQTKYLSCFLNIL